MVNVTEPLTVKGTKKRLDRTHFTHISWNEKNKRDFQQNIKRITQAASTGLYRADKNGKNTNNLAQLSQSSIFPQVCV